MFFCSNEKVHWLNIKDCNIAENRFYFREGSNFWVVIWAHVGDIYNSLREKCPYSELVWSAFFRIRTEYEEIFRVSPYSVQMRENADQNNSEYRHILHSGISLLPQHSGKLSSMNIITLHLMTLCNTRKSK